MTPRFDPAPAASGPIIQGFSDQGFVVDGTTYDALLLTPHRAESWRPPAFARLGVDDLTPLLTLDPAPEFVLIGAGAAMLFPSRELIVALDERGIGVEAMDSRAAARAWHMLRSEGRWIVAALMPFV